MAKATARHILVATQEECEDIKKQIENVLPDNREGTWANSPQAKWLKNLIRLYLPKKSEKSTVLSRHSLDTILLKLPVEANERVEKLTVRASITKIII
jgi:hypothetical protein